MRDCLAKHKAIWGDPIDLARQEADRQERRGLWFDHLAESEDRRIESPNFDREEWQ